MTNANKTLSAASLSDLARALIERSSDGTAAAVQTLADVLRQFAVEDCDGCPVQLDIAARLSAVAWETREAEQETM